MCHTYFFLCAVCPLTGWLLSCFFFRCFPDKDSLLNTSLQFFSSKKYAFLQTQSILYLYCNLGNIVSYVSYLLMPATPDIIKRDTRVLCQWCFLMQSFQLPNKQQAPSANWPVLLIFFYLITIHTSTPSGIGSCLSNLHEQWQWQRIAFLSPSEVL